MVALMVDIALPRRSFEGGWLKAPSYDIVFIIGVLVLAVGTGLIVLNQPSLFGPALILDLWFLGYHHVIATFTKLAATPEDRKENRFLIYYLPPLVLMAVFLMGITAGVWLIATIYLFWQWYHYTRQAYGISIFYHRKAQRPVAENPHFAQAALWSIPIWGILNRCHQGWDKFLGLPVWLPPVPAEAVALAASVSCLLVGLWLVHRAVAWWQGSLPLGGTLFTLSHFTAFYVGYVAIPDINIGWLVANIWHNAQYILFVRLYNTNRFSSTPSTAWRWLSWSVQPGPMRALCYFSVCLLLTTLFYGSSRMGFQFFLGDNTALLAAAYVVTYQTVNFHHYIVDALIWKARKKKNRDVMGLPDV